MNEAQMLLLHRLMSCVIDLAYRLDTPEVGTEDIILEVQALREQVFYAGQP